MPPRLQKRLRPLLLLALGGCCRDPAQPSLNSPAVTATPEGTAVAYDLTELVVDSTLPEKELTFEAFTNDERVDAQVSGGELVVTPAEGFAGDVEIQVTAIDKCDARSTLTFTLTVGAEGEGEPCKTRFAYAPQGDAAAVYLAGSFNGWDAAATPLTAVGDGTWEVSLELAPGAYPYKFVEVNGAGEQSWSCDPEGDFRQCDAGYTWATECVVGGSGCNSLAVVEECSGPALELTTLSIDRENLGLQAQVAYAAGAAGEPLGRALVTLDGAPVDVAWDGASPLDLSLPGLAPGRHTLRVYATDAAGQSADPIHVPLWLDARPWEEGLMYFAFVDRFYDGDPGNNAAGGASVATGEYLGGDWQGALDKLDYLEDLGVSVLWLTAPWDNPAGAYDGSCGLTITGYHGYWPAHPTALEEHFGDRDALKALIDAAHARGMRVLVDWVGNHVHEEHPYAADHPDWFAARAICEDGDNWNAIPETCWFASYLPDIDYYNPEPLAQMVDTAVEFAKAYDIDGFRVDAVKHMPHSVHFNLQSRIRDEIEHRDAGGDEEFYTVGETFSGDRGLIASYVNERELDGQFDFNTYWAILSVIARDEAPVYTVESTFAESEAAYGGALMSTFLGNHDVERFIAHAAGEVGSLYGDGLCPTGEVRGPDEPPGEQEPYLRLKLAWTWLLTHEGLPLVYYGDEIGLPGYSDPDNRQMMRFDEDLSAWEADVLAHVQALGQARRDEPALLAGDRVVWWGDPDNDVLAWARASAEGQSLVVINRSGSWRTLTNGLAWAELDENAAFTDLLTGQTWTASGDSLTLDVEPWGSMVLVAD